MDGPMWSQDENGLFWLVFPNKHAIPKEEINKIFSVFGTVVSVTSAGDARGFRFVSYGSIEEVELAVLSLKTHPLINLIPHRPKNKSKPVKTTPKEESGSIIYSTNQVNTNFFQRRRVDRDNSSSTIFSGINESAVGRQQIKSNDDETESVHSNSSTFRSRYSDSHISPKKSLNGSSGSYKSQRLTKSRGAYSDSFNTKLGKNEDMDIPDLVTKDNVNIKSKVEVINAEEVIVANIHDDYGPAYVLHLFDDYEPLSVSYMKTTPNNSSRYCHVYFTNEKDSIAVEKKFDNYNLDGKNLVVFRIDRLIPRYFNKA